MPFGRLCEVCGKEQCSCATFPSFVLMDPPHTANWITAARAAGWVPPEEHERAITEAFAAADEDTVADLTRETATKEHRYLALRQVEGSLTLPERIRLALVRLLLDAFDGWDARDRMADAVERQFAKTEAAELECTRRGLAHDKLAEDHERVLAEAAANKRIK